MFNLLDMENSDAWNCLSGIEKDKDLVQSIAEVIIKNTASNANERQDFLGKGGAQSAHGPDALCRNPDHSRHHGTASHPAAVSRGHLPDALQRVLWGSERRFEALPKGHPALAPYGIFKLANRQIRGATSPLDWATACLCSKTLWWTKSPSYNEIDLTLPGQSPAPTSAVSPRRTPRWSF